MSADSFNLGVRLYKQSDLMAAVKRQLPNFHLPEATTGAALGALAGLIYDRLKKEEDEPTNWWRALIGAGLGGFGANLVGDRLRRAFTNYPLTGYNSAALKESVKEHGWEGLVKALIYDQPVWKGDKDSNPLKARRALRYDLDRELVRRATNVFKPDPGTSFFVESGTVKGIDGKLYPRLEINPRFLDPETGKFKDSNAAMRYIALLDRDHGLNTEEQRSSKAHSPALGGHVMSGFSNSDVRWIEDLWDILPETNRREKMMDVIKYVLTNPHKINRPLPPNLLDDVDSRDRSRLGYHAGSDQPPTAANAAISYAVRALSPLWFTRPPIFKQTILTNDSKDIENWQFVPGSATLQGGPDNPELIERGVYMKGDKPAPPTDKKQNWLQRLFK